MAALEVGGTPPTSRQSRSSTRYETGKANFLDVHTGTGKLVGGATLNLCPTKNIDRLFKIAGTTQSPLSPTALKIQVGSLLSPQATKSHTFQESPTSVAFFDTSEDSDTSTIRSAHATSTTPSYSTSSLPSMPSTRYPPTKEFLVFAQPIVIK